ncbi:MAG: DJ-1/PfpI family protein [Clostridia bacterium]
MNKIIYIYVLDSFADWEIGYLLQALSNQGMINNEVTYEIRTVGLTRNPIKTIGGLTLIPDCTIDEIDEERLRALLLVGANTWNEARNNVILDKAIQYLDAGVLVGAICGATLALAELGALDNRNHTSNSLEYLLGYSKGYKGKEYYKNELSVADKNLISASSAGGLLWARQIIEYLAIYTEQKTEAWYQYYATGDAKYFMEMIARD